MQNTYCKNDFGSRFLKLFCCRNERRLFAFEDQLYLTDITKYLNNQNHEFRLYLT